MKIVTSGSAYIDIDAYAGCIAYAELLQLEGVEARAVSTAPFNETITPTVLSWGTTLHDTYEGAPDDAFTLIDVSDPAYFDSIVQKEKVVEIIDHHPGFEAYWQAQLGDDAWIEPIGAACSMVYERWVQVDRLKDISQRSARLLMCGILDNTLNFGAAISSERDRQAYEALKPAARLPRDWPAFYFTECQQAITADIASAVINDTKVIDFPLITPPVAVGQLTMWGGPDVLKAQSDHIYTAMKGTQAEWFMNLISLEEGRSYFVTDNQTVRMWLERILDVSFTDDVAVADRMWLRKEIIGQAMRYKDRY